jgi:hypothetical protein
VLEVGFEYEMAKKVLVVGVEKLPDVFLPVADDSLCFSDVRVVMVDDLYEIRVVVAYLDVVFSRDQGAFHEPSFIFRTRHEAQGIRREYPLEVRGDVIAFHAEDESVVKLARNGHEGFVANVRGRMSEMSHIAQRVVTELTEQAFAVFFVGAATPDNHGFLGVKRRAIINKAEMSQRVELEQDGRSACADWPAFDKSGKRLALRNVSEAIEDFQPVRIAAGIAIEVKEIHALAFLSEMSDRGPLLNVRAVPSGGIAEIVGETALDCVLF